MKKFIKAKYLVIITVVAAMVAAMAGCGSGSSDGADTSGMEVIQDTTVSDSITAEDTDTEEADTDNSDDLSNKMAFNYDVYLPDYFTVDVSGDDGFGEVEVSFDWDTFAQECSLNGVDSNTINSLEGSINYTFSPKGAISNGDTITVDITYDSDLADSTGLSIGGTELTYKATDLWEPDVEQIPEYAELIQNPPTLYVTCDDGTVHEALFKEYEEQINDDDYYNEVKMFASLNANMMDPIIYDSDEKVTVSFGDDAIQPDYFTGNHFVGGVSGSVTEWGSIYYDDDGCTFSLEYKEGESMYEIYAWYTDETNEDTYLVLTYTFWAER